MPLQIREDDAEIQNMSLHMKLSEVLKQYVYFFFNF